MGVEIVWKAEEVTNFWNLWERFLFCAKIARFGSWYMCVVVDCDNVEFLGGECHDLFYRKYCHLFCLDF